jgi:hypothetical protein
MTAFALPTWFQADGFSLTMQTMQRAFSSTFGGSEQVIDQSNDRWIATLSAAPRTFDEAAAMEAFINGLRGMTNTVAIYHLLRRQPRGTLRGSPVLSAPVFVRDPNLPMTATPGATLLAGDMLGCSGQLLQVRDDVTADAGGSMNVTLVNRLRFNAAAGAAVVWDRPTAPFRLASRPAVQFVPGYAQGVPFDFVEAVG